MKPTRSSGLSTGTCMIGKTALWLSGEVEYASSLIVFTQHLHRKMHLLK